MYICGFRMGYRFNCMLSRSVYEIRYFEQNNLISGYDHILKILNTWNILKNAIS